MGRDARWDPRPGDVISRDFKTAKGGCIVREVERAHGGFVGFYRDNGYQRNWHIKPVSKWRQWAKGAEVIHRAE